MTKEVKYKTIDFLWCPKVPSHWEVIKLKWISKIYSGGTPDKNKTEYWLDGDIPWLNSGSVNQNYITEPSDYITQEGLDKSSAKWIPENSIVIALAGQGKTKGMSAIVKIRATCNQSMGVICPIDNFVTAKYLHYFLKNNYYNIRGLAGEESRDGLNLEMIGDLQILIPLADEQLKISNYLDEKTAQIDTIVSKKENLIEQLKEERIAIINQVTTKGLNEKPELKPSGIDWIKEIPKNWTTKRIKHIATTFGRIGYRGYQTSDLVIEGEGAITLSPSNMKDLEMDYTKCTYLSWEKYDESPEIQIENGDVIFVKTGSTFGKTALVNNLPEKATINPQLLVFKNIKISNDYFYFVLLSELIRGQVNTSVIGGTIPTISQEKIGNYYLFVPPVEEQKEIVLSVRKHFDRIRTTISKIEQEIELIKEYKAALINEVVTGKLILN